MSPPSPSVERGDPPASPPVEGGDPPTPGICSISAPRDSTIPSSVHLVQLLHTRESHDFLESPTFGETKLPDMGENLKLPPSPADFGPDRMKGGSSGKRPWRTYLAVASGVVVVVVLAVILPTVLCRLTVGSAVAGNGSAELAQLQKALIITNQSLAEAHGHWESCRKQLGELEGKASELEQALARVTELQEANGALKAEVAQQQEQLADLQSSRAKLQLQNQQLEQELQDMMRQHSGGNRLPAVSLSLLALLLSGMLHL